MRLSSVGWDRVWLSVTFELVWSVWVSAEASGDVQTLDDETDWREDKDLLGKAGSSDSSFESDDKNGTTSFKSHLATAVDFEKDLSSFGRPKTVVETVLIFLGTLFPLKTSSKLPLTLSLATVSICDHISSILEKVWLKVGRKSSFECISPLLSLSLADKYLGFRAKRSRRTLAESVLRTVLPQKDSSL